MFQIIVNFSSHRNSVIAAISRKVSFVYSKPAERLLHRISRSFHAALLD